jgi:hypothetical protein
MSEAVSGVVRPAYRFAHAGYTFEQIAPRRVDGDGETWIIICRADANATAGA